MLRGSSKAFVFLLLGVIAAMVAGEFLLQSSGLRVEVRLIQQLLVAVILALGLTLTERDHGIWVDFRNGLAGGAALAALQIGALLIILFEYVTSAAARSIVDTSFRSFGLYPSGADVWLPAGLVIWLLSIVAIVGAASILASSLRRLMR